MQLYYLFLCFKIVHTKFIFCDSNFSKKEKIECCGAIISNISYAPICVLEGKDIKIKHTLKIMLRNYFEVTCIVKYAFKFTSHDSP